MSRISAFRNDDFPHRRLAGDGPPLGFDNLDAALELLHPYFRNQTQEHARAIFLDDRGSLCGMGAWVGEQDYIELPIRRIVASALAADAAAMILAHNHPSGDPDPGPEDIRTTRDLSRVCAVIGIRLIDHVIIAGEKLSSMRALRLI